MQWVAIGFGGLCGAILRYSISRHFASKRDSEFPWPIFLINMIGSTLLGWSLAFITDANQEIWRNVINVGFLGAFTTYSTFNFEVLSLLRSGKRKLALLYLVLSLLIGPICAWVGVLVGSIGA